MGEFNAVSAFVRPSFGLMAAIWLQCCQEVMVTMDSFILMGARPLVEPSPSMRLHELLDRGAIAAQLKGLC